MFEPFFTCSFYQGLKAGVKPIIEVKFPQLNDTKSLLAAVVKDEVAAADCRDWVHALELEISALQKQAKTWQSTSGSGSAQNAGGSQAPAQKPPASRAALGLTHGQKVAARTKWIICFKCKQWGKHRANECRLSQDKISALTPQDPEKQPSGEPKDSQFYFEKN